MIRSLKQRRDRRRRPRQARVQQLAVLGPLPILVIFALGGFVLGLLSKTPCTVSGWVDPGRYTHLCYSDIPPLYSLRGFADNVIPYVQNPLPGKSNLSTRC